MIRAAELNQVLGDIEFSFPTGFEFYNVDGIRAFQIRGPSGGIMTSMVCYIVTRIGDKHYRYGIMIPLDIAADPARNRTKIRDVILKKLIKFKIDIDVLSKAGTFDPDGGDLGVPDHPSTEDWK